MLNTEDAFVRIELKEVFPQQGATVATESFTGTWTTVWTYGLTSLDCYKGRHYHIEDFLYVPNYIFFFLTLDNYVIDVHFDILANMCLESPIHYPLVRGSSVLQSEQYSDVVVHSVIRNESNLLIVLQVHSYLVITAVDIKETQPLMNALF